MSGYENISAIDSVLPGTGAAVLLALLLDWLLGEPRRWHPLIGLGRWVAAVESRLNHSGCGRGQGVLGLLLVLVPVLAATGLLVTLIADVALLATLVNAVLLYLVIGARSLAEHARAVSTALTSDNIDWARTRVSYMVSRDTSALDEEAIARATLESVLENGSDAVFAPLFWFLVAGPLGAVAYRLVNTLDAMWGYRNERFLHFGWAAARLDDWLNWVPARLCALSYGLVTLSLDGLGRALNAWRQQAPLCASPNAGPVMASGAGALNLRLGGEAIYHGQPLWRPLLGQGQTPVGADIERGLALVRRGIYLWLLLVMVAAVGL